jgi:hypothetical protein
MNDLKTTAEYYRRGLMWDLDLLDEAMAWIDQRLVVEAEPDIALIEASLSGSQGRFAVADWLAQVPGEFNPQMVARRLLVGLLQEIDRHPEKIFEAANGLYEMAIADDWPDLEGEDRMRSFDDELIMASSHIHYGYYGYYVEEIREELVGFLLRAFLLTEVARFRQWAYAEFPEGGFGEWECDYYDWNTLQSAVFRFVAAHPFSNWSQEERNAILYALARDNEGETIADEIGAHFPDLLLPLIHAAMECGEREARWQLTKQLAQIETAGEEPEQTLRTLAQDEDEYVRRMALAALARRGSPAVEELAEEMWERADPQQEYTRMMVLSCLQQVGSPKLEILLAEAEQDTRLHLRKLVERIRNGEIIQEK